MFFSPLAALRLAKLKYRDKKATMTMVNTEAAMQAYNPGR